MKTGLSISWILEDTDDDCDPVTGSLQYTDEAQTKFISPKEITQQECNYYYELEVRDNNGLIDSDGAIVKVQSADIETDNKPQWHTQEKIDKYTKAILLLWMVQIAQTKTGK